MWTKDEAPLPPIFGALISGSVKSLYCRPKMVYDIFMVPGYKILGIDRQYAGKYIRIVGRQLSAGPIDSAEAVLFPGNRRIRVKELTPLNEGKTALTLKGAPKDFLLPGAVLLDGNWPVFEHREGICLHGGLHNLTEPQLITGGITPDFNEESLIGSAKISDIGACLHVRFPKPYPMLPGMNVLLHASDSTEKTLTLILPGVAHPVALKRFNQWARSRRSFHSNLDEIYEKLLHFIGYQQISPNLVASDQGVKLGAWIVLEEKLQAIKKYLLKTSSIPGGMRVEKLTHSEFPQDLLSQAANWLCLHGELILRNGWYFPPSEAPLSPFHCAWLEKIRRSGKEGIRARSTVSAADIDALKVLCRSGFICGGKTLWLSVEAVDAMAMSLLSGTCPGDTILIADVRARIGGSRSLALELLGILESQGRLLLQADKTTRMVK